MQEGSYGGGALSGVARAVGGSVGDPRAELEAWYGAVELAAAGGSPDLRQVEEPVAVGVEMRHELQPGEMQSGEMQSGETARLAAVGARVS